ncbi:MAG: hypothetical protein M1828_002865 [Chrysothrix sp. TS-e1954]|nr:MAG: hypothetical protein M1828_002865 [Chrysothrix sp. TS-e1954]
MSSTFNYEGDSAELADRLPDLRTHESHLEPAHLMVLSDEEVSRVYRPPTPLAARLRRSSTIRRKSSAASSRRNSLASSHSHHSNRPYRNTYHSDHVAQHLRRTSILESRKARLADRAAHAEQVRLRAALVKATPRATNTEGKVIAAQQARQKHLAKVAAVCAEEVSRVKRKAEEMKEKKATEERRCRLELEEKQSEAERRRLEYKKSARRPRTVSGAPTADFEAPYTTVTRQQMTVGTAVSCIQETWRYSKRRHLVRAFQELGLSVQAVRNSDFIEASTLLANTNVIERTKQLMDLLEMDSGDKRDETLVRRFLSAYMICGHAAEVFSKQEQQEEDLMTKALDLLIVFEDVISKMSTARRFIVELTQQASLMQAYASYMTAFAAWKTEEASMLIETMIDQFVAFDAIWQTVKDDTRGEVGRDYQEAIRDQQVILFSKIRKLAGIDHANTLIKRAIRANRRAMLRHHRREDNRPRPLAANNHMTAISTPTRASWSVDSGVDEPSQTREGQEAPDISRVFSVVPDNRTLIHELAINPYYRIESPTRSDARDTFNREICSGMRQAVQMGQDATWTTAVAENIRGRLLKLLKPGNSMYQLLSEVLDSNHVRAQCLQGAFSYGNFFVFMADLLPRLCAPVRDPEVKMLAETLKRPAPTTDIMIENLFALLHTIDLMSLDYTNYMLQQASSTLIEEAPGYERRLFASDLESHVISLHKTKRWWRHASLLVLTETGAGELSSRASFTRTYARGLIELVARSAPVADHEIPETLHLDHARLARVQQDLLRFTVVGAILSTAKNLLKRDIRSQWTSEAGRIDEAFRKSYNDSGDNLSTRILSIIETTHRMPTSSREQLGHIIARFLAEAQAGRLSDPVLRLMSQRLRLHVYTRLAASTSLERVRVASTTSEALANIGLSEFMGQVRSLSEELVRLSDVDQAAHMVWYRVINEELDSMSHVQA